MSRYTREAELRELLAPLASAAIRELPADADLVERLGLDSLTGLRLLAAVEKRFGVRFPDERLREFRSLGVILEFMASQKTGPAEDAS